MYVDNTSALLEIPEATSNLGLILAPILGVFLIFALITYLCSAIGFYKLAKKRGIDNAWMSFIPIANIFLFANTVQDVCGRDRNKILYPFYAMIVCSFLSGIIPLLFIAVFGIEIWFLVEYFIGLYNIYKVYLKSPTLWLVLSIILGFEPFVALYIGIKGQPLVAEDTEE